MHILTEKRLADFARKHPKAKVSLALWIRTMRAHQFRTPHELKAVLPATDMIGDQIAIFDVGGNNYRITAKVLYADAKHRLGKVFIMKVETHADYSRR